MLGFGAGGTAGLESVKTEKGRREQGKGGGCDWLALTGGGMARYTREVGGGVVSDFGTCVIHYFHW